MQTKRSVLFAAILLALSTAFLIVPTHAVVGGQCDATLYIYTTPERTTLAPQDEHGNYLVLPGETYYFTLTRIAKYTGTVQVWASYWNPPPWWKFTNIKVASGSVTKLPTINFTWTIPELPEGTIIRFKYCINPCLPGCIWHLCKWHLKCCWLPTHVFVIPEGFLGPLGALAALFSGFKVTTFLRRKKEAS